MSPVLEPVRHPQTGKMGSRSCPAEKTTADPLLGSREIQKNQNGATPVIIHPEDGKINNTDPKGLLSLLKAQAHCWAVWSLILNLILLIVVLVTQSAKKSDPCPANPVSLAATCLEGWVGYLGKCYYFSEAEADWASSQSNCFSRNSSLARIDTPQEMDFMKRYKGLSSYWIGLHRDPGQPWKWTNGTKFNNWFTVMGGEKCAFMNQNDIASSSCSREGRWICSKPVEKMGGKET